MLVYNLTVETEETKICFDHIIDLRMRDRNIFYRAYDQNGEEYHGGSVLPQGTISITILPEEVDCPNDKKTI